MWGPYKSKWMCFVQHLFSLSKGKEMKGFCNAYQVSAGSITYVISHLIFKPKEVYGVALACEMLEDLLQNF